MSFKYVDKENAQKCAEEIIDWCLKHALWTDTSVYVNGKVYRSYNSGGATLIKEYTDPDTGEIHKVWESEADPWVYFEYVNHDHFISMSFEGALNHAINYLDDFVPGYDEDRNKELDAIFEKYGYYFEQGHSWNLSAYKL